MLDKEKIFGLSLRLADLLARFRDEKCTCKDEDILIICATKADCPHHNAAFFKKNSDVSGFKKWLRESGDPVHNMLADFLDDAFGDDKEKKEKCGCVADEPEPTPFDDYLSKLN